MKIENIVWINYKDYNLNENCKQNESGPIVDHYSVRTSDAGKKLLNAYQFYAVVQQEKWAHLKVDLETSLSHPKAHTQRKGLAKSQSIL